ncbi:MAG TPA: redoxin domain-containing protein [Bryobacteraceae bacterium]|nr:redoxin domain-containing protein [Bryobacteraceae bacterium]
MFRSKSPLGAVTAVVVVVCSVAATDLEPVDLAGKPQDPLKSNAAATVLLFVRTDCPITNRYAPELQRLAKEFQTRSVAFWLVYPDPDEAPSHIEEHVRDYGFPGRPLRDPHHVLVKEAHATVAPEAAVFNGSGKLVYHGRIDDRYVDIGKTRPAAQVHDLEDAVNAVLTSKPIVHAQTRAVGCSLADVE